MYCRDFHKQIIRIPTKQPVQWKVSVVLSWLKRRFESEMSNGDLLGL